MAVIEIREYTQRFMADEARGLLEEAGIDCMVSGDDGGGTYPQVQFTSGYRVLIQEEDVQKAEEVLSVLGPYTPPEGMGLFRE